MSSPQTAPIVSTSQVVAANIQVKAATQNHPRGIESAASVLDIVPKHAGYGLPCSKCKTYYTADLATCPVCKSSDRVAPIALIISAQSAATETLPDPEIVEQERERFLRDFQLNVAAANLESESTIVNCSKQENHKGDPQPATLCQGCYDHLQERVDVLEAVLHMDLKEAAEVIYDAVWSDPSDPSKTYLNAASALLAELRKRSGITQVFGPLQPMSD
ncbi:MAG TPA: hypothetical protein VFA74_02260 [Terriglobales bacterium]|nr:hypothetical protein [Terriglobales bacterium]